MDVAALLERASTQLSVQRAFGPSYEHEGAMIVPVALIVGGGGGGDSPGDPPNAGGGFGGVIYPLGAYVARNGDVRFRPSFDATVMAWAAVTVVRVLLTHRPRRPR